ncbi:MAG TPA: hypothetical protein VFY29_02795 [Terriglobia bacterium]|nr:hypothetical protein [Terriglobia bacterium]
MKTRLCLLAVALAATFSIVYAEDGDVGGKWSADSGAPLRDAGAGGAGGGCFRGAPGSLCPDAGFRLGAVRAAELNLSVNRKDGRLTGSIVFPSGSFLAPGNSCGKLKIEEGRVTGQAFSFTTYRSVNGSRIPAHWLGEITDTGVMTLRTFDTLPCNTGRAGISELTGRPVLISATGLDGDFLVYRRGDASEKSKETPSAGPAGKWWTTDNGRLTALSFKVGTDGKLTGSVNVCGVSEMKVEEGLVAGRSFTFTTERKANSIGLQQAWSGEVVNDRALRVASSSDTPCRFPSSTTLVFTRSK